MNTHWQLALTNFSLRRPGLVLALVAIAVILFASRFPQVHFDNDPENMLAADEPVRIFHNTVKQRFGLYDFLVVGVVNEAHPDGVFNVDTLGRVHALTGNLLSLRKGETGAIEVQDGGETRALSLQPSSVWKRLLNLAFRHDPEALFEDGESVIIGREVISPSVVDSLKQAELGALKMEYLMETAPTNEAEARQIRDDAMANPLYKGTLVSENGRALAIYVPIVAKHYSHNVANLVEALTADWPEGDQLFITGLPVAEDTFGVEMLVQMASSAPLAGVTIFFLMLLFFHRVSLIIAPMLVALVSIICTMGLLIGLGYDVHIMSSMIAIFLMPIAVVDSVHILSEFFDAYRRFEDKAKTIRRVVGHLFMPMLYTTLTTIAGFASLAFTPIPPVRVFGLHVAFGVGVAWLLTMTFVPAYIMLAVGKRSLSSFGHDHSDEAAPSRMRRLLAALGSKTSALAKPILAVAVLVIALAGYGIAQIKINDNPVKWFVPSHPIRIADRVLNEHFGGTYTAYLVLSGDASSGEPGDLADDLRRTFDDQPAVLQAMLAAKPTELPALASQLAAAQSRAWNKLADAILDLEPDSVTRDALAALPDLPAAFTAWLAGRKEARAALQDAALDFCDQQLNDLPAARLEAMHLRRSAPLFKRPAVLNWVRGLQEAMHRDPLVGKTSSAVDALQKANYELSFRPGADNERHFAVPESVAGVGQVFTQLEGMKKKDSLFHMVSRDYQQLNIWVQLKSGDNRDMAGVVAHVADYIAAEPPPLALRGEWAGLTYLNVVWQDRMVSGMLSALGSSWIVVLVMMVLLFRSLLFGLLAMIPLSVTIAFIYGLIGLVGKDYDMPVAVLSSLTLGLSVDFAIHFLERARELTAQAGGNWQAAVTRLFAEPAAAISRNAVVIAAGFLPLLFAPLVPYRTVGFFLATIMAVSAAATLVLLPALLTLLQSTVFPATKNERSQP
jgi:predicted RND superfamily exporter protein